MALAYSRRALPFRLVCFRPPLAASVNSLVWIVSSASFVTISESAYNVVSAVSFALVASAKVHLVVIFIFLVKSAARRVD